MGFAGLGCSGSSVVAHLQSNDSSARALKELLKQLLLKMLGCDQLIQSR